MCLSLDQHKYHLIFSVFAVVTYFITTIKYYAKINQTYGYQDEEHKNLILATNMCSNTDGIKWSSVNRSNMYLFGLLALTIPPCHILNQCTTFCFRIILYLSGGVNMIFMTYIRRMTRPQENVNKIIINAFIITMLPPLWMYSNLFCADSLSLTFFLAAYYYKMKADFGWLPEIFALISVSLRYENSLYFIIILLKNIAGSCYAVRYKRNRYKRRNYRIDSVDLEEYLEKCTNARIYDKWFKSLSSYIKVFVIAVLGIILCFVEPAGILTSTNVPQMFYFPVFIIMFAWPHYVATLKCIMQYMAGNIKNFISLLSATMILVQLFKGFHAFNPGLTLYDPSKHFLGDIFYSHTMEPTFLPILIFIWKGAFYLMYNDKDVRFTYCFTSLVYIVLGFERDFSIRNFIVPYVLMRLHFKEQSYLVLLIEFMNALIFIILSTMTYVSTTAQTVW